MRAHTTESVNADMRAIDAIPGGPSGHGSREPGELAKNLAIAATQPALSPGARRNCAAPGQRGMTGSRAVPSSVTGATNGEEAMFARRA
jgi:hypothetical protein